MNDESVIWTGRQWRVTDAGIEQFPAENDQDYRIDAEDLDRGLGGDGAGSWPAHMAEKPWVDLDDFLAAFRAACGHAGVDADWTAQACECARRMRSEYGLPPGSAS